MIHPSELQNAKSVLCSSLFICTSTMNTDVNIKKPTGLYGYRMVRGEHSEIEKLARHNNVSVSGLIRGLLREWRARQTSLSRNTEGTIR